MTLKFAINTSQGDYFIEATFTAIRSKISFPVIIDGRLSASLIANMRKLYCDTLVRPSCIFITVSKCVRALLTCNVKLFVLLCCVAMQVY